MKQKRNLFKGTHPSGRTAEILQFENGMCEWRIFDTDGKSIRSDTTTSVSYAKNQIKRNTFNMNDAMRSDMAAHMAIPERWTWTEIKSSE